MIRVWGKKLTQKELTLLSVLTVHFEEPWNMTHLPPLQIDPRAVSPPSKWEQEATFSFFLFFWLRKVEPQVIDFRPFFFLMYIFRATDFPLINASAASHRLGYAYTIIIQFEIFSNFSSVYFTHTLFRCILFNFQIFEFFLDVISLLISFHGWGLLLSENICIWSPLLNLWRLVLCPSMCSILMNVFCGLEKNVCSEVVSFKGSKNKFNNVNVFNIVYNVNIVN